MQSTNKSKMLTAKGPLPARYQAGEEAAMMDSFKFPTGNLIGATLLALL